MIMPKENTQKIKVGRRVIEISSYDKMLFPNAGYTKGNLAEYYAYVAEVMLPHVEGRPVNMQRAPDGLKGEPFYQQEMPDYFPGWIESQTVSKENGRVRHVLINNKPTLVYMADQGVITPHVWLSRTGSLRQPDRVVFDLDPPKGDFGKVRFAAQKVKELLDEIDAPAYVMTTGSKGVHVIVPLRPQRRFDTVRDLARRMARLLVDRYPDCLTLEHRKAKRRGRVFVDYLRNARGQTTVAPYAVRLRKGAPVAAPVDWNELANANFNSQTYNIGNMPRRLAQKKDPWRKIKIHRTSYEKIDRAVSGLLDSNEN